MNTKHLQKKIIDFRDKRDWKQFHNTKDLSISLLLEAAELLEHFQWKNPEEIENLPNTKEFSDVKEELADVYYYLLLITHDLHVNLEKEFLAKMKKNTRQKKPKGATKNFFSNKNPSTKNSSIRFWLNV